LKLRLRFLDHVTGLPRFSPPAQLTFENWRGIGRDQLETRDDKLGIHSVARRLVNFVTAEMAGKFVFIIIVRAELQRFAIGSEFLFFIQHDQLRAAPWLVRLSHVSPEFKVRLKIT